MAYKKQPLSLVGHTVNPLFYANFLRSTHLSWGTFAFQISVQIFEECLNRQSEFLCASSSGGWLLEKTSGKICLFCRRVWKTDFVRQGLAFSVLKRIDFRHIVTLSNCSL